MYKTRYLYDIIICSVWVPFLGVHFFPSWSIAYICGLCLTLSFLFHCLIQMLIENIILGSMVCSMWWLLLRWWKSCVYCKWLAYCTSTCLFKGILSWQWFYAICPFCSCDTQYSTSGKFFFGYCYLLYPVYIICLNCCSFILHGCHLFQLIENYCSHYIYSIAIPMYFYPRHWCILLGL